MRPHLPLFVVCLGFSPLACGDTESSAPEPAPTQTAAERLCAAITSQLEACGAPTPCDEALVADCAGVVGIFSDPFLNAATGCLEGGGDIGTCLVTSIEGLETTDAQRAFAEQFCGSCAFGVPGCVETLFEGGGETQAVGRLLAPLSDGLVTELAAECASSVGCAATFSSCAQGVLAARGIPDQTVSCLVGKLTAADETAGCAPGTGGSGGADPGPGSGGGGSSGLDCNDDHEPNDVATAATMVDAHDDGKLSDCEPAQTSVATLAGSEDSDWYSYYGMDGFCGFDKLEPHAYADPPDVRVCVYLKPLGASAPPSCLEGNAASLGDGYTGCCGLGGARLGYGANLQNDDALVLMHVSDPSAPEVCIDYQLTYRFGE